MSKERCKGTYNTSNFHRIGFQIEKRVRILVCGTLHHLEVCFPEFLDRICFGVLFCFFFLLHSLMWVFSGRMVCVTKLVRMCSLTFPAHKTVIVLRREFCY